MMYDELRFIWNNSPVGIAKVSRIGRFISANPRYCEIVGYSETELLGTTFQKLTHPDDVDADSTEAQKLADSDSAESYQMQKRYITKEGRSVWVNLLVYAVRKSTGEFDHFYAFIIELTPVAANTSNASFEKLAGKPELFRYIQNNPKESFLLVVAIFLMAQGKNIGEVIMMMFGKQN